MRYDLVESPVGELLLVDRGAGLAGLYIPPHRWGPEVGAAWTRDPAPFAEVHAQLAAYWAGELRAFDVRLDMRGTPFQQRVWELLCGIPFAETISYGELARRTGDPGAARAVGAANGRNPVSIVVPCHRVIGASGALVGYGGGLDVKAVLLAHEARIAGAQLPLFA